MAPPFPLLDDERLRSSRERSLLLLLRVRLVQVGPIRRERHVHGYVYLLIPQQEGFSLRQLHQLRDLVALQLEQLTQVRCRPWILSEQRDDPHCVPDGRGVPALRHVLSEVSGQMHRRLEELVGFLARYDEFPCGVVLLTGTGIVPGDDFALRDGDEVAIEIESVGTLRNCVRQM